MKLISRTQSLRLEIMLEGIKEFTEGCKRVLISETMLVQDVKTSGERTEIQLYFLKS
jgi:wyosine [tRNA(Phe)-imidazoG37] synthetase (radical SAM superfamily)